jgi:CheY-like chemotaxis protein
MTNSPPSVLVLVVDDNPGDIQLWSEALSIEPGLAIVAALTVKEALSALRRHNPPGSGLGIHLVLIDLHQPCGGAIEALQAIRESPSLRDIPVIVMTGAVREADRQKCRDLGALDVWTKPFDWDECIAMAQIAAKTARAVAAQQTAAAAEWRPSGQPATDVGR